MILVNGVFDLPAPRSCAPNLVGAPIALDHQKISRPQPEPFDLTIKEFDFMHSGQIERAAPNIRHAKKRKYILYRTTLLLLLDTAAHLGNRFQGHPSPPRRKFLLAQASSRFSSVNRSSAGSFPPNANMKPRPLPRSVNGS